MKKHLWIPGLALILAAVTVIQFIPPAPLVIPAQAPAGERAAHRVLPFEGIANFRDLGGYPTEDGHQVRWGSLYRSGNLSSASRFDLEQLQRLQLNTLVDFRSTGEKTEAPDRLPEPRDFKVVSLPILDEGNSTMIQDIKLRMESGDFAGFDPNALMRDANRQFATTFTPEYQQFLQALLAADGQAVLWHCTAGKDRAGFAAAIVLRLLGVPRETIIQDYLLSDSLSLEAHSRDISLTRIFKGREVADNLAALMGVKRNWIEAAFAAIDEHWGDFDSYARDGLQLSPQDITRLRAALLE
ncbi:MAG: tyrosine-protein phosphatase [Parahaliea sp.]